MCGISVLDGLWGKNTDKDTSQEGASTLRHFHLVMNQFDPIAIVTYHEVHALYYTQYIRKSRDKNYIAIFENI